jgi:hypothetical protein
MLKALLQSFKKSRKLKALSQELAKPLGSPADLTAWLAASKRKKELLLELIAFAKDDEKVAHVIARTGATDEELEEIYSMLQLNGAGQYVSGHFVPASSLVYWQPLYFILYHYENGSFKIRDYDEQSSRMFIANRLVEYFRNGETGGVGYDG